MINSPQCSRSKLVKVQIMALSLALMFPEQPHWMLGASALGQPRGISDAGRDWGQEEKGMTEDEMAGWHHQLDGREFE